MDWNLPCRLQVIAADRRVRGMRDNRELYAFVEHLRIDDAADR